LLGFFSTATSATQGLVQDGDTGQARVHWVESVSPPKAASELCNLFWGGF